MKKVGLVIVSFTFFFLIVSTQVHHSLLHAGREGLWPINRIKAAYTSYCFPSLAPSLHLPVTTFSYSLFFRTALLIMNSHSLLCLLDLAQRNRPPAHSGIPFVLVPKSPRKCHLHLLPSQLLLHMSLPRAVTRSPSILHYKDSYFQGVLFNFPRKCFQTILPSTSQIKLPACIRTAAYFTYAFWKQVQRQALALHYQ